MIRDLFDLVAHVRRAKLARAGGWRYFGFI
jgi:hypothetical protein